MWGQVRIRELEALLEDAANNVELESRIDDLERQLRQARAEAAKLRDEVDTLKSEVEREKKNCARAESKVKMLG